MKINVIKLLAPSKVTLTANFASCVLFAADDFSAEKFKKLPHDKAFEIEVKIGRNPEFHAKVFKFLRFCFHYWKSDREFMSEESQFDKFREDLTIIAGFYEKCFDLDGGLSLKAKSISYANMEQDEFASFYSAIYNAAIANIFRGCDAEVERELIAYMPR